MRTISIIILLFISSSVVSQNSDLFATANAAYKDKNYKEAITAYTQVLDEGFSSAELCYNLGTAYLQDKQLAKAILYFEKASRINPSDNRAAQNLAIAREEIDSPVVEIPEFFLLRFWKSFANLLPTWLWTLLQLLSTLLLCYAVYLWRLGKEESLKFKGFSLMLCAFAFTLISYFAGRTKNDLLTNKQSGIVMEATVLMSGPDSRSDEIEPLSEGVKIKILDSIDEWYKVALMNKEQGWMAKDKVEII